jgi:putrescine transport system substrate-binding protein
MVLVAAKLRKHKPMTETPPRPELEPTKTGAEAAERRSKAFGTFLLAAVLSALLLLAVGVYLALMPDPGRLRPTAPASQRSANVVVMLAPRHVVDADLLGDFESETGAAVELISYDNEESLLSASSDAALNADVILAAATSIQSLSKNGALNVLPARAIPNLGKLDPALRTLARKYDSTGLTAAPFAWTMLGLAVNRAIASNAPRALDTWATLFDPAVLSTFEACGVQSLDAPSLAFPAALLSLGLPPFSDAPNDVERASAAWETIRAKITAFDTRGMAEALAAGKACLALSLAGDAYRARAQARDAGQPAGPEFVVPREGGILRLYMLAVPRAAQNSVRGAGLIDYLLRPEISARMTNAKGLANAVPASQLYVRQDIKTDAVLYPDVAAFARLIPDANPPPAAVGLRERFWQLMNAAKTP